MTTWTEIGDRANRDIDKKIEGLSYRASSEGMQDTTDFRLLMGQALNSTRIARWSEGLSDAQIEQLAEQEAITAMRNR